MESRKEDCPLWIKHGRWSRWSLWKRSLLLYLHVRQLLNEHHVWRSCGCCSRWKASSWVILYRIRVYSWNCWQDYPTNWNLSLHIRILSTFLTNHQHTWHDSIRWLAFVWHSCCCCFYLCIGCRTNTFCLDYCNCMGFLQTTHWHSTSCSCWSIDILRILLWLGNSSDSRRRYNDSNWGINRCRRRNRWHFRWWTHYLKLREIWYNLVKA